MPSNFQLETLETRVLFSADSPLAALADMPPAAPQESRVETLVSSSDAAVAQSGDASVVATALHEMVIIDAGVPDLDALLADFQNRGDNAPSVFVLVAGEDPLIRIGEILAGKQGLEAVHLISHGEHGALELGGQRITVLDLLARAGEIAAWRDAFAEDADLLLYGCDVAGSADGRIFVDTLAHLSGADVAASNDVTGASTAGGNWALEYRHGQVEGQVALSQQLQEDYTSSFAVYSVTTLADSGSGSLRQAIIDANASPTFDQIHFDNIAGEINLITALPEIADTVTIDATTAQGYVSSPVIRLNGSALTDSDGINLVKGSDSSEIKGLMIVNFDGSGIKVDGASSIVIESNYIGTDGATDLGNGGDGISMRNSVNNVIGGAGVGNVISGNSFNGIFLGTGSGSSIISGNSIGTDAAGDSIIANEYSGVEITDGSSKNTIGGNALAGEGNLISGNGTGSGQHHGIHIHREGTDDNVISGNRIGTNAAGTDPLANVGAGVVVETGAGETRIGGITEGERNLISGNSSDGIRFKVTSNNVVIGNYIGTNAAGDGAIRNGDDGVEITRDASFNTIGGTTVAERNIISGNQDDGVLIDSSGSVSNIVSGNYIGTDASGTEVIPNGSNGIQARTGASSNIIGSGVSGGGNLLSGNNKNGILVKDSASVANAILGNYIGTDFTGTMALGNGINGVSIESGASASRIGGGSGEGNVISGNGQDGIHIQGTGTDGNAVLGNLIGTDRTGSADLGNTRHGILVFDGPKNTQIGGSGSEEGNVIAGNGGYGVIIDGNGVTTTTTTANTIKANVIGLDSTGSAAMANALGGVSITNGAGANTVGGNRTAGEGNIVSGHTGSIGITVEGVSSAANIVAGNLVGTDATGSTAFANTTGILNQNAPGTVIGGTASGEGNLVSGNTGSGIVIDGTDSADIVVYGNIIGATLAGTAALGNGGAGVQVSGGSARVTIGGVLAGSRNVIAANGLQGVSIDGSTEVSLIGNYIGTGSTGTETLGNTSDGILVSGSTNSLIGGLDSVASNRIVHNNGSGVVVTGASASDNAILGNIIFDNLLLGIDLGGDGATSNDLGVQDADSGPNSLQNAPELIRAGTDESSTVEILGSLDSEANTDYRIEFFANSVADPGNAGEAERYLGFVSVISDSAGLANFSTTLAVAVAEGEFITATATRDSGSGSYSNSSEFATNIVARELNVSPTISSPSAMSAAENQTTVDTINATDANTDTLTYSIEGGADELRFSIGTTSAELTFNSAPDFETEADADGNGIYEVVVRVTDEFGSTDDRAFSVTVTNVNEPAIVTGTVIGTVTEGNVGDAAETTSGSITISDPDAGDSPGFNNVGPTSGDNVYGSFELNSGTWTYTLDQSAVQNLDAGDDVTDTITYTATDGSTQQITVTITGTDDASVIGGVVDGAVSEGDIGDAPVTATGTIAITDADDGDCHH